jgi:hypothetical protein
MDSQMFRPVTDWEGLATVVQDGRVHEVWLKVLVVRQVTADADGAEHDNGHRIWTARVTGPLLKVGSEVMVTLPGGRPIGARVTFDQSLLGSGVPSPINGISPSSAGHAGPRVSGDRCPELRAAVAAATTRRNDVVATNAQADNEARPWPRTAADLVESRLAVDIAAREARRAGCDIDDLVSPDVGHLG